MTGQVDRVAVVVSANHGLIASLPFHCSLPLDFDGDRAATAAVVLIDVPGRSDADEVLEAFRHVAFEKIVLLGDREVSVTVGRVLVRPVSVSEIGAALEAVAEAVSSGLSDRETSSEDEAARSRSGASPPLESPPEEHEGTGTSRTVEEAQAPTASQEAKGIDDAPRVRSDDREPLFDDVTPTLSTADGWNDSAAASNDVEGPAPPDAGVAVPPAEVRSSEEDFRWHLKRGTTAAQDLARVLVGYPALADPKSVVAEVAAEAAEGAGLDMLGLWRNDAGAFVPLGGYALRPSDVRRPITMEHPIVQEAWRSGGLVITRVADDPAVVAGLPGVYEAAMLLLPLATAEGHEVLVIGAGVDLDELRLQMVEDSLRASASVIDFGIALEALLAALEL